MEKSVEVVAWPDLFERSKKARDFLRLPKWGRTLHCAARSTRELTVTLNNTQELVNLCQAQCVPFLVQHQRKLDGRMFTGLVTQAYSSNGRLAFKVLYPYKPGYHYEGVLYETLSGAACRMYADYNEYKMSREKQATPFVQKANSNGWCHLMCEVNCSGDDCNDHSPFEFVRHMENVFPPLLRKRLSNNLPCEFHTGFLPAPVQVNHSLELDHLMDPKRMTRTELTKQELSAVDAAASVLRTISVLYAQETFTNEICRQQLYRSLQTQSTKTEVPKKHRVIVVQLQEIINRLSHWEEEDEEQVKVEKKQKRPRQGLKKRKLVALEEGGEEQHVNVQKKQKRPRQGSKLEALEEARESQHVKMEKKRQGFQEKTTKMKKEENKKKVTMKVKEEKIWE